MFTYLVAGLRCRESNFPPINDAVMIRSPGFPRNSLQTHLQMCKADAYFLILFYFGFGATPSKQLSEVILGGTQGTLWKARDQI